MKKRKNDILEYVDKIIEKEKISIYEESAGTIIMKNGFIFQVGHLFNFFRDTWFLYTRTMLEMDDDKRLKSLKMFNGGVISNGSVSIDLDEVSAMISANEEEEFNLDDVEESEYPFTIEGLENDEEEEEEEEDSSN